MKITKKRFSCWEYIDDEDYQKDLDDELIISVNPEERSRDIADYILEIQEKAKDHDWVVKQAKELEKQRNEYREENKQLKSEINTRITIMFEMEKENKELKRILQQVTDNDIHEDKKLEECHLIFDKENKNRTSKKERKND